MDLRSLRIYFLSYNFAGKVILVFRTVNMSYITLYSSHHNAFSTLYFKCFSEIQCTLAGAYTPCYYWLAQRNRKTPFKKCITDITRFYFHSIGACSVSWRLAPLYLLSLCTFWSTDLILKSCWIPSQWNHRALLGVWCRELVCSSISSLLHQMFIPVERNKKSDFKVSHFESHSCIFHF